MRIQLPSFLMGLGLSVVVLVLTYYFREDIGSSGKVPLTKPEVVKKYPFINPIREFTNFENVFFDEMTDFKTEVIGYLDSLERARSGYEISFYFKDLTNGNSVGYNENAKYTPASLMKVPVLIALLRQADKGKISLQNAVTYDPGRMPNFANSEEYTEWKANKSYTLKELAEIMIKYSDNLATTLIIDKIKLNSVLEVQDDLNLGLDREVGADQRVIDVKKYATVFRTIYNSTYLSPEMSNYALELLSKSKYKGGIRRAVPTEIKVAHKFGRREHLDPSTNKMIVDQLHQYAIVFRPEKTYLLGIMIAGHNEEQMERMMYRIAHRVDTEIEKRISDVKKSGLPPEQR